MDKLTKTYKAGYGYGLNKGTWVTHDNGKTWDYISELYDNGIAFYCNDEGKLQGLHPALVVTKNGKTVEMICGNILFCGYDSEGETVPLTDKQISIIKSMFTRSMYVQNSNIGLNAIVGYTIDIGKRGKK